MAGRNATKAALIYGFVILLLAMESKTSACWQERTYSWSNICLPTAQSVDGKEFGRLLKDLRQMQNSFDHEFLVSKEDQEFHSTYDTILRLGTKALNAPDQKLLLQIFNFTLQREVSDPGHSTLSFPAAESYRTWNETPDLLC